MAVSLTLERDRQGEVTDQWHAITPTTFSARQRASFPSQRRRDNRDRHLKGYLETTTRTQSRKGAKAEPEKEMASAKAFLMRLFSEQGSLDSLRLCVSRVSVA